MVRYILVRSSGVLGVLLAVSLLTFFLMHAIPGGPFDAWALEKAQMIPQEIMDNLNAKYGLNKPVWQQYLLFLRNAIRLDFGYSFSSTGRTILQIFRDQWPYSIQLGLLTLAFSGVVGLGLGIAAAVKQGTWVDYLGTVISIFCLVTPSMVDVMRANYVRIARQRPE